MRPVRVASCLLVVALAVPAGASPPSSAQRHLLADPLGDAAPFAGEYDIVCADFALSRSEAVAVLRVAGLLDTAPPVFAAEWRLSLNLNGTTADFQAHRSATGQWSNAVAIGEEHVVNTLTIDAARQSLVWRVPRRIVRALNRPRLKAGKAVAETNVLPPIDVPADKASTSPGVCPA